MPGVWPDLTCHNSSKKQELEHLEQVLRASDFTIKLHSDEVPVSETTSHTPDIAEDDRHKVLYLLYIHDIRKRTQ